MWHRLVKRQSMTPLVDASGHKLANRKGQFLCVVSPLPGTTLQTCLGYLSQKKTTVTHSKTRSTSGMAPEGCSERGEAVAKSRTDQCVCMAAAASQQPLTADQKG